MSELLVPRTLKFEFRTQAGTLSRRRFHTAALGVLVAAVCATALAGCASHAPESALTASATAKPVYLKSPSAGTARAGIARVSQQKPNPSIPLPGDALLERQPAPDCEFRATPSGNVNEDTRMKLDYQQQCYRHAEGIVRTRLDTLQDSVGETIKAVRGR